MRWSEEGRQVVCFENHAEWRLCMLFLVPRLTPVERPSSLLWRVVLRAVARVALFCARFAVFLLMW